jgi:RHS repeat-associated protein
MPTGTIGAGRRTLTGIEKWKAKNASHFPTPPAAVGNLYIADYYDYRIRKVLAYNGAIVLGHSTITTVVGNGTAADSGEGVLASNAEINAPYGISLGSSGNLYISDVVDCVVREVFAATGYIYTIAGNKTCGFAGDGGVATSSELHNPYGITLDSAGNIYIPDVLNQRVRAVVRQTPTLALSASPSAPTAGQSVAFTCRATYGGQPVTNGTTLFFLLDGASVGSATTTSGAATWTASFLTSGQHDIRCASGDSNYEGAQVDLYLGASLSDSGTVSLKVNGTVVATTSYGAGSTPSSIAEGLVGSYSNVNVTAVNDALYIEATGAGASSNYTYSLSSVSNYPNIFTTSSFQESPDSGNLGGGAGASTTPQTIYSFCISSSPGASCSTTPSGGYDAVGNVLSYYDSVMGTWSMTTVSGASGYDTLNRLVAAQASTGPYQGLEAAWSYDSFGNRDDEGFSLGQNANVTAPIPASTVVTPLVNNQIQSVQMGTTNYSPSYDPSGAGYLIADPGSGNQYLYDGEGRICAVSGPGGTNGYVYDAEGNRIAKGTLTKFTCDFNSADSTYNGFLTTNNETDYVLGPGGEQVSELAQDANGTMNWQRTYVYAAGALIATYDPSPDTPNQPLSLFRLTDWLGAMRVTTDSTGVAQGTCMGLPYGDGMICYNPPDPRYFTGKERDSESGNDYFGARYYASAMGRFLSPDWAAKIVPVPYAKLNNPQSLNLYAYVGNNPLSRRDPDGHYMCTGNQCDQLSKALAAAQNAIDSGQLSKAQVGALKNIISFYGEAGKANGVNVLTGNALTGKNSLQSGTAGSTLGKVTEARR